MDLHEALRAAVEQAGWSTTKLAAEAGVTEHAARRWVTGVGAPSAKIVVRLQKKLPGFSKRLLSEGANA